MTGSRRTICALVLSFAVYLTPLVGPHAAWLLGEAIWHELAGGAAGRLAREPLWVATDAAVALGTQLAFFALSFWFLGRPGLLRGLALIAPIVPAIVLLNFLYLIAIPSRFLIERDTAPERLGWPLHCSASGVWIPQIAQPIFPVRDEPIWVVEVNPPSRYGLFDPGDCAVQRLELSQSGNGYVTYVAGGHALYATTTPATGRQSWLVFSAASGTRTPLDVDQGRFPILSTDGRSAAWLRPVAGSTPPIQLEAVVRSVESADVRVVDLSALGRSGLELLQLDPAASTLLVARGLRELSVVDLDGRVRETFPPPADLEPQPHTFRFLADGWVAWDATRDDGPYRVAWSLPSGRGVHRVPRGRSITSLAPSADGRWIALSVTSQLSIGSTPDAVSVLRAADGSLVFRRYFPKYTRSTVAFAGGRFVYTDLAGVNALRIE